MKIILPLLLLLIACESSTPKQSDSKQPETEPQAEIAREEKIDAAIAKKRATGLALEFMNGYVKLCDSQGAADVWIAENKLLTPEFKKFYKNLVDKAWKADPELGLDSDPIFDAQDYPSEGFEVESFDEKTNTVVLRGKEWKEFKVTVHIDLEQGRGLVAAVGEIQP